MKKVTIFVLSVVFVMSMIFSCSAEGITDVKESDFFGGWELDISTFDIDTNSDQIRVGELVNLISDWEFRIEKGMCRIETGNSEEAYPTSFSEDTLVINTFTAGMEISLTRIHESNLLLTWKITDSDQNATVTVDLVPKDDMVSGEGEETEEEVQETVQEEAEGPLSRLNADAEGSREVIEADEPEEAIDETAGMTYDEIKEAVFNTMVDDERVFKFPKENEYFSVINMQFPCKGAMLLTIPGVSDGKLEIASMLFVFNNDKDPDSRNNFAEITYWEVEEAQQENVLDLIGESLTEYIDFANGGKLTFCMTQDLKKESQILYEYSPVISQYSDKDVYKTQNYRGFDSYGEFRDEVYSVLYNSSHGGMPATRDGKEKAGDGVKALQKGSKGEEVARLQNRLNELGYLVGKADGVYGNKTKSAIEQFQKEHSLEATGIADEETQELLYSEEATSDEAANDAVAPSDQAGGTDEASLIAAGMKYISNSVMDIAPTLLSVSKDQCRITEIYYLDKGNDNYQFTARVSRGGPGGYGIGKDLTITSATGGGWDIKDSNHITMYGSSDTIPGDLIFGDENEAGIARGMQILGNELKKLDFNGDGELSMDEIFKMN